MLIFKKADEREYDVKSCDLSIHFKITFKST